ncbi:FliM/FliN family flagellar motor switch protein [Erythrobacter sp. WG]|uniref:FliM/FliN family flagellar motor switch protein n=1 Tax=Erythrobacter sp. WG TaxID=2985510 RepID=UPI00226F09DB|nr:FliM/FliN family flagellar motor switch protein [Erythrobacter sp. WG]MCX9148862.1 FliM/FliN family flagellar motor switch protein [Erythrobacter sp. WG]
MNAFQPAAFSRFGDVAVRLSVELGRAEMPLRDVLMLGEGSTVTLDRLTDELLDVTANGRVIARGEVVAEKGRFALRIVSLVGEDGQDVPPPPGMAAPAPGYAPAAPAAAPEPAPLAETAPAAAPEVDPDPFNLDELLK